MGCGCEGGRGGQYNSCFGQCSVANLIFLCTLKAGDFIIFNHHSTKDVNFDVVQGASVHISYLCCGVGA